MMNQMSNFKLAQRIKEFENNAVPEKIPSGDKLIESPSDSSSYGQMVKTTCNKEDEQVDNAQQEKDFSQADPRSPSTDKMTVSAEEQEYSSKNIENERQIGDEKSMEPISTSTAASHHCEEPQLQNQKAILGSKLLQSETKKNVDASN